MIVVMPNGNGAQQAAPGEAPNSMVKPQFMNPKTMDGEIEKAFPDIIKFVEKSISGKKTIRTTVLSADCLWEDSILCIYQHIIQTSLVM